MVPPLRTGGEVHDVGPIGVLERDAAAGTTLGRIAHDQVGIDHEPWTYSVAWANTAGRNIAICIGCRTGADRIGIGRTHDDQPAAIRLDRRVGALIEENRVVVHVNVQVEAIGQLQVCNPTDLAGTRISIYNPYTTEVSVRMLTLSDVDAAGERSGIVEDVVVGDLQIMVPCVDEDAAAALRAVADPQAIDA